MRYLPGEIKRAHSAIFIFAGITRLRVTPADCRFAHTQVDGNCFLSYFMAALARGWPNFVFLSVYFLFHSGTPNLSGRDALSVECQQPLTSV